MKKWLSLLLSLTMAFSLSSCLGVPESSGSSAGGASDSSSVQDSQDSQSGQTDTSDSTGSSASDSASDSQGGDSSTDTEEEVKGFVTTYSTFNPETDSPYKMTDVVKTDLMWDTATLFAQVPETKEVGAINLGENITSFKFKSVAYNAKAETWVFGAIGMPNAVKYPKPAQGYPAVILIHGGAMYVNVDWINYWTNKGFVALAFDVFGNQLDANGAKAVNSEGGPGENDGPLNDNPDNVANSWMYHSITNAILCNNLLRANADVNSQQIGVTGISWGGVVTNVLSGVDKRIASFAPVYGAGYLYEDEAWASRGGYYWNANATDKQRWIDTFDPSTYLAYSTKPMLFVSGIDDVWFSPKIRMKSAQLAKGKVFYSQRSDLGHGDCWRNENTYEIYAFFLHTLLGQDTVSQIGTASLQDAGTYDKIYFSGNTNVKFSTAKVMYTTSTDANSHSWQFTSRYITISNGWCTVPKGITAYCIEYIHTDIYETYKLSTPIYFV